MKNTKTELSYVKTWNSDNVLNGQFSLLTEDDKLELVKILKCTYEKINKSTKPDIFYSIFLHVLNKKVELSISFPDEPEITVKHLTDNLNEWK